ncbi:hypothetical protein EDD52_12315 [Primorskyibacter sedentarius]|uniref:Uncharacterized protein n=1 Tax=Primorskyibacter sedentarius TaxID=745311 RepID=A0A4R3J107_9RHOB|nr:hypothetical protein EDD52_12315 [Primorskyibacter sedentarius]
MVPREHPAYDMDAQFLAGLADDLADPRCGLFLAF